MNSPYFPQGYISKNIPYPNAALPPLSGEDIYWHIPNYKDVQLNYARNGIYLSPCNNPTHHGCRHHQN